MYQATATTGVATEIAAQNKDKWHTVCLNVALYHGAEALDRAGVIEVKLGKHNHCLIIVQALPAAHVGLVFESHDTSTGKVDMSE